MTTDLEKQFYTTFGIKPREFKSCDVGTFCPYPGKECGTDICPYYRTYKIDYPEITDRILLELICLHNIYLETNLYSLDYKSLKEEILKDLIDEQELREIKKDYVSDDLKHQVRTLFKEER